MSDRKYFWKNKNVLITGSTGFVGRYLLKELVQLNANITALVRNPTSPFCLNPSFQKVNFLQGDLEDLDSIKCAIAEHNIDTVFHMAAQAVTGEAILNPLSTFETNIRGTWNMLDACRQHSVKRVIITSSEKAYGESLLLPLEESFSLNGRKPYDVSKSCADLIAHTYYETYQLPVCIIRCGNLYGGGDVNFSRIIPGTIRSILHNEAPIIRGDGTQIHDFFYVKDAVHAHLLVAEKMEEYKLAGEAFNFGNENALTVLEVVQRIIAIMNSNLKPVILKQNSKKIAGHYLSAKKAKEVLTWQPVYSFEKGIEKTVQWYKEYF
ncbi:NAD-dependent epimerase/dehydratase family protein [Niallia sp. 01092]|uniref:NAD-dependent epimerase/dehydratase family protein n=1 Tax=unclassified Niallia TaxID=2837522 RepID=UPI003FD4F973